MSWSEADEKFQAALEEYLASAPDREGLLIDWVLVAADHIVDDRGSGTGVQIITSREQSLYRTNGLANYAVQKTNKRMWGVGEG